MKGHKQISRQTNGEREFASRPIYKKLWSKIVEMMPDVIWNGRKRKAPEEEKHQK